MLSIAEWLTIRDLKGNLPDVGTRKIAEYLGRSRGAVRKALASERYCKHTRHGSVVLTVESASLNSNEQTGGPVARRNVLMNEIIEGIYQWHKGTSIQAASRSLGIDRKTLRKYLTMAKQCGVDRTHPLCDEYELAQKLNALRQVVHETPAMNALDRLKGDIERWLADPTITAKKIWQLAVERGTTAGYASVKRYLNAQFPFEVPEVTVHITTTSGYVARRIPKEAAEKGLKTHVAVEHHVYKRERNEKDNVWMRRLVQGDIGLDELTADMGSLIPPDDTAKLYECALCRPVRYRNRALSVLSLLKGISQRRVSEYLLIARKSVNRSYVTYKTEGVQSIVSDKGKRLLKQDDPVYADKVFSILHSPPSSYGFNRTSWRQVDIKKVLADNQMPLSRTGIRSIIKKSGFKYRKARTVLTSNDPLYREKVEEIKSILSNLGPKEKFFSIDEYGPFAVKLQGGKSLVPAGETKTVPQWQKSKGSIILTAALELSTNQVTHFYSKRKTTAEMIELLDILVDRHADEERIYFSWDAASWHASKELYRKVDMINSEEYRSKKRSPLVKLAPLPTCAQFLNVIESVFSGMARAIIHNSDYQSVDKCKAAIDRYVSERNEYFKKHPKKADNRIWGKERVEATFKESNNCKDPMYCR